MELEEEQEVKLFEERIMHCVGLVAH